MAKRGLLALTGMWGSQHSPNGAEFVSFAPIEAGPALLELRAAVLDSDARLEATRNAYRDLADQLHTGEFRDQHGHRARGLAALTKADGVLDRVPLSPPAKAKRGR
jgi:hypothetical protein